MNIYLDIDQVLKTDDQKMALHAKSFLTTIIKYPVYWLTADYGGNIDIALNRLIPLLDHDERNLISLIQPGSWDLARTEAIDFSKPFLWFTHSVDEFEMEDLERHSCVDNLYLINTTKEPHALKQFSLKLPEATKPDTTHSPYKYKLTSWHSPANVVY